MNNWRADVSTIRERITGTPPQSWRNDLIEIAKSSGHNPRNWREAVRLWASGYGIQPQSWRHDLSGIAQKLGSPIPLAWREALRFIRQFYESDVQPIHWYDAQTWNDDDIWNDFEVVA